MISGTSVKVYVIIATYNAHDWIIKCLDSVDVTRYAVVVIDNASTDDTVDIIRNKYNAVCLICGDSNLGFGKANNVGIRRAIEVNADFVFLLNQDAWLEPDTIEHLVEAQERHPEFWILSPLQKNSVTNTYECQFGKYVQKCNFDLSSACPQEVAFVGASLWLMSRECINTVGGFDPLFPHYGEDNDYVRRVHYWRGKIGVYPRAIGYHERVMSVKQISGIESLQSRSELHYLSLLKNVRYPLYVNCILTLLFCIYCVVKSLCALRVALGFANLKALYGACHIRGIAHAHRESKIVKAFL